MEKEEGRIQHLDQSFSPLSHWNDQDLPLRILFRHFCAHLNFLNPVSVFLVPNSLLYERGHYLPPHVWTWVGAETIEHFLPPSIPKRDFWQVPLLKNPSSPSVPVPCLLSEGLVSTMTNYWKEETDWKVNDIYRTLSNGGRQRVREGRERERNVSTRYPLPVTCRHPHPPWPMRTGTHKQSDCELLRNSSPPVSQLRRSGESHFYFPSYSLFSVLFTLRSIIDKNSF